MAGMSNELHGRRAVVTGASSGIGAATARTLAAAGAHVTLIARRRDRIEALAAELGGAAIVADVGDRAGMDAAAVAAGEVDLVVANAGVMLPAPAEESPAGDLARMLDANLIGLVNTTRAFAPALLAAAERGTASDLVVVSSILASTTFPGYAGYSATKAGASAYARTVRGEWGPRGVRVTTLEPGLTATELREHVRPDHKEMLDGMIETIRSLAPEDVADVIGYVVSRPTHVNLGHLELSPTAQP
jgi:NADP-dependent 3-hydroxy acid dehydrogenase YdfG